MVHLFTIAQGAPFRWSSTIDRAPSCVRGYASYAACVTQSVELLLDAEADAAVRADWSTLLDAGLPSQGRNTAATNRPHITVWAGEYLLGSADRALATVAPDLPMPIRLGALAVFGRRRFIVVRLVVTSIPLLVLQQSVAKICGVDPGSTLAPGRWTPHVTLARGVTAPEVGRVMDVIGPSPERSAKAVSWRRWDGDARREWTPSTDD